MWVVLVIGMVGQAFNVREWDGSCFIILILTVVVEFYSGSHRTV